MSFTHTTQVLYKTTTDGVVVTQSQDQTAPLEQGIDTLIAAGAVNVHIALGLTVAKIIMLLISASAAITIKTNSSSSPSQTFNLSAGQVITWNPADSLSNPLTVDVTDFYFSNSGGADAVVKMRFLLIT